MTAGRLRDGPGTPYQGRVELTWTNKPERLLADEDGSYQWVPTSDYRVAEVRLLDNASAVGQVASDRRRAGDNLLIRGDALNALTSLSGLPEFAKEYAEGVKLVYLDPPFNTGQSFLHYDDALEHSVWLTMMRDRLVQIKKLLASDGSVWVHCDDSEQAHLRVAMNEVFGPENFIATVAWEKADSPRMDARNFSIRHDYIIIFAAGPEFRVNRMGTDEIPEHYTEQDEEGRAYYLKPLRAMAGNDSTREARPTMWFPLEAPDGTEVWPMLPDGGEGRWRWSPEKVASDRDRIEWIDTERGWSPYYRIYDTGKGRPPETFWTHQEVGSNRTSKREIKDLVPDHPPFDTPKPERLMQRIIEIGSDPGDVVLDCFAGSGTTAAVAHKLGRRWITVERESDTLENFILPRLAKVVAGEDPGGITGAAEWEGGGGFRVLDVAPSMFAEDQGLVMLAEWATNGKLAEATAAQLGFAYEPDTPFSGKKGRTRLVVIDGLVSQEAATLLAGILAEGENLILCGTVLDPAAGKVLRELRPGSKVRKIPASILDEYRLARWSPVAPEIPEAEPDPITAAG
jgi:adenine-specific DNA-methyltransferase